MVTAIDVLFPSYALGRLIYEKIAGTDVAVPSDADVASTLAETERQENEMRRLEAQAKVAQEMAIASRIESAAEVQIEEFYEYAGEGKLGLNADEKAIAIGASAAGRRVSKRVYRFIGSVPAQGDGNDSAPATEASKGGTTAKKQKLR